MDFSWAQEQTELYKHILDGVRRLLPSQQMAPNQWWTRAQWEVCGTLGLLGLCVPQCYGGRGLDALTSAYALEAFGYGCTDMGLVFSASAHLLACVMPLVEYGSEILKERLLPGLCSGMYIGANAITESEAGSDIYALKMHAQRDGDNYILNGQKSYVSNGPVADLFVIYATTNPTHGYLGISAFVVERDTPGLIIGEPFDKMGLNSTPVCQLSLHKCCVSAKNVLGKEGQGAQIFKRSMAWERACLFAAYLGQMERELECTVAYAKERRQFGKPIGKYQAISHRIADMKLRLESARLLLYHACWLLAQEQDATLAIALSKLAVSEAAIQGGLDAIQIHGSSGFSCMNGIEHMLRDAIPSTLFSGTSEMQRDIIANGLGL